jgi:hypothetical protein
MSNQSDYTPEEWKVVVNGPAVAGTLIVAADPAFFGAIKESAAIAKAINAYGQSSDVELIRAIGQAVQGGGKFETPDVPKDQGMEGTLKRLVIECKKAADIVEAKSPDEAEAYSSYLVDIAQKTAESSKEGGFLGIGATRVSDKEKHALAKLAEALGVSLDDEKES